MKVGNPNCSAKTEGRPLSVVNVATQALRSFACETSVVQFWQDRAGLSLLTGDESRVSLPRLTQRRRAGRQCGTASVQLRFALVHSIYEEPHQQMAARLLLFMKVGPSLDLEVISADKFHLRLAANESPFSGLTVGILLVPSALIWKLLGCVISTRGFSMSNALDWFGPLLPRSNTS